MGLVSHTPSQLLFPDVPRMFSITFLGMLAPHQQLTPKQCKQCLSQASFHHLCQGDAAVVWLFVPLLDACIDMHASHSPISPPQKKEKSPSPSANLNGCRWKAWRNRTEQKKIFKTEG